MWVCGTTKIQRRSLHGILLFQQSPLVEMKGWTSARKLQKGRSAHKIPPLRGVENCSYETKSINRASPCFKHQQPARKRLSKMALKFLTKIVKWEGWYHHCICSMCGVHQKAGCLIYVWEHQGAKYKTAKVAKEKKITDPDMCPLVPACD